MRDKGPWVTPRSFYDFDTHIRSKSPTYEQAIVHMYREAKAIVAQGYDLKDNLRMCRRSYQGVSAYLDGVRKSASRYARRNPSTGPYARRLAEAEAQIGPSLDFLWEAQEKYNAWAKLYGDI